MLRFMVAFLFGFIFSICFLGNLIIFINIKVLNVILISSRINDYFQLGVRISLSYFFGASYFYFKLKKYDIILSGKQIYFSMIGLILLLIAINVFQVLVIPIVIGMKQVDVHSILALWLTFPSSITFFTLILKYGLKQSDIKWLW